MTKTIEITVDAMTYNTLERWAKQLDLHKGQVLIKAFDHFRNCETPLELIATKTVRWNSPLKCELCGETIPANFPSVIEYGQVGRDAICLSCFVETVSPDVTAKRVMKRVQWKYEDRVLQDRIEKKANAAIIADSREEFDKILALWVTEIAPTLKKFLRTDLKEESEMVPIWKRLLEIGEDLFAKAVRVDDAFQRVHWDKLIRDGQALDERKKKPQKETLTVEAET